MRAISQVLPTSLLNGHWRIRSRWIPKKALFPVIWIIIILIGLLTPLFDLGQIHGVPSVKLYVQHLWLDSIGAAGAYYAATFCSHWYHKIPIAIAFDLGSTFLLVTLIG
jgi:hypothetical protein